MSSTLYWRPVVPTDHESLSDSFKLAIVAAATDGEIRLAHEALGYLRGMKAAGSADVKKDCDTLIEAIEKHGEVVLWLEY